MTEKNIILLLLFFKDFLFFDVDRFWSLYSTCYNIVPVLLFWLRGVWNLSSPTRDGICTPCVGRRSPKHWTTREVPGKKFKFLVWAIAGKTSSKTEGVAGTYYGFLAHCRKKKKNVMTRMFVWPTFKKNQLILMFKEVRVMNNECLKFTWIKREKSLWVILT